MARQGWTIGIVSAAVAVALVSGCQKTPAPAAQQQGAASAVAGPERGRHHFVPKLGGKNYIRDRMSSEAKLTAALTEGRWTFLDEIWHPGFTVGPHFHNEHAETFYLIAGQVEWTVNGESHLMGPGDLVYIPPDTVHATRVIGDQDVQILMIYQPGGHEVHLEDEQRYTAEQRAQPETLALLRSRYDFNPAPMPKAPVKFAPLVLPALGDTGPRSVRPALTTPRPAAHRFVMQDQGETFTPEHEISTVKLNADDTDGRYSFLDEIWKPGMTVEPHYHAIHAEVFYIVDGQVEWTVGGETRLMGAGDLVYIPPNTVHSVKVIGEQDLHTLMLFNPGGYEYFWRRSNQFTPEQRKDPEISKMLRAEQDFHPVGQ